MSNGEVSRERALTCLAQSSALGNLDARLALGYFLAITDDKKSRRRAIRLFQYCAERGSAEAAFNAAVLRYQDVQGEATAAFRLFKQAAASRHAKANAMVAFMLVMGEGTPADPVSARRFLENAVARATGTLKTQYEAALKELTEWLRTTASERIRTGRSRMPPEAV